DSCAAAEGAQGRHSDTDRLLCQALRREDWKANYQNRQAHVLVQREVESGRSLLASIQPFRRASLGDTAPMSRWWARRRSAEAATGFNKKPLLADPRAIPTDTGCPVNETG